MTAILRAAAVLIAAAMILGIWLWFLNTQVDDLPPRTRAIATEVTGCPYRPVMGLGPWSWHLEPVCN